MDDILKIKVVVDKMETTGEVRLRHFSKRERGLRSLKFFGLCWGAAVASILIPIAHFILVPGFFIAGIFVPFYVYDTQSMIMGGEAPCPKCGSPIILGRSVAKWPLKEICKKCGEDLRLIPVTDAT